MEVRGKSGDMVSFEPSIGMNFLPWGDQSDDTETNFEPTPVLHIGSNLPIMLDKMYGPLVFAALRIVAEQQTCEWVIQRESIDTGQWVEVARIPGQIDTEFESHTG